MKIAISICSVIFVCLLHDFSLFLRQIVEKLDLMYSELNNMTWWCHKIVEDVSGTAMEHSAGILLERYSHNIQSLRTQVCLEDFHIKKSQQWLVKVVGT